MFKIARRAVGDVEPFIHNLSAAEDEVYALGEALKLAGGKLTKASGADTPTHICMGPVNEMGCVPVIAVAKSTYFETTAAATVAETLIGTAVTIAADGLGVTATEGGSFVIDETDGDKLVVGHFGAQSA